MSMLQLCRGHQKQQKECEEDDEKMQDVAVAERGSRLQTAHRALAAPPERTQRALDEVFTA